MENIFDRKAVVLIVDDSSVNIDILYNGLNEEYDIRIAMDAECALEAVRLELPDLIILDVVMPGMDGYELCSILKSNPATSKIPVIFLTSLSEIDDESKGLKIGAVDFISKPFNIDVVRARVKNILSLKFYRNHLEQLVEERTKELALTKDAAIMSMAVIAECRDNETGLHIKRTQEYVRLISQNVKDKYSVLQKEGMVDLFAKSAPLHDIGKVGVPDNILLKPGKLTDEEFEEMKKHTVYGYESILKVERIIGENSFLSVARELTHSHHEKWDGSGYPLGLKGEEIPLVGRIMALADVYDALTTRRVYKDAFSHSTAVSIITAEKGSHFDSVIVDAFLKIESKFNYFGQMHRDE